MSYKEIKNIDGSFEREWRNACDESHRACGPAYIYYRADSSIVVEMFILNGEFLGTNKKGFWALWDRLDDKKRQNQELLKYLMRLS
jgi:hypothetical protein